MSEIKNCPICDLEGRDVEIKRHKDKDAFTVNCSRCGDFIIARSAQSNSAIGKNRHKISAWIREQNESGRIPPEIDSGSLNTIESILFTYSVREKLLLLMHAFERRTKFPGQKVQVIPECDYPLAWAECETEFKYLIDSLIKQNLISVDAHGKESFTYMIIITSTGWNFLENNSHQSVISDQAFVAMSFSERMIEAWKEGIEKAIEQAGYRPYRIDIDQHIEKIDSKIIVEIKKSKFVVADVTEQKAGVYFEAGYACGMNLPVFWCVREDDLDNVHFDTRQYNHIIWKDTNDLKEKLNNFIVAIVGKGPKKSGQTD